MVILYIIIPVILIFFFMKFWRNELEGGTSFEWKVKKSLISFPYHLKQSHWLLFSLSNFAVATYKKKKLQYRAPLASARSFFLMYNHWHASVCLGQQIGRVNSIVYEGRQSFTGPAMLQACHLSYSRGSFRRASWNSAWGTCETLFQSKKEAVDVAQWQSTFIVYMRSYVQSSVTQFLKKHPSLGRHFFNSEIFSRPGKLFVNFTSVAKKFKNET